MTNIWIICRKELKSYFASPIAYVLMAILAFVMGVFFYSGVVFMVQRSSEMAMTGRSQPVSVNEWIVSPVLMNYGVVGLFFIPMLSMRLFAEEKRSGTIELLATSPVHDYEIIIGKWAGAFLMYAAIQVVIMLNFAFLFIYSTPNLQPMLVAFLGLLLLGGAILSIGTFISALTKNQIIAGVGGFAICLVLWILSWWSDFGPSPAYKVISYLSIISHFEPFNRGLLELKDVIYFLSVIFLGLFLTARAMESLRWRS